MIFRKNSQEGSSALAGIMAVATLALATFTAQQSSIKTKQSIEEAKNSRGREAANIGATNTLARFKSLVSVRKQSDGTFIPTVFAENYYKTDWNMIEKVASAEGSYGFKNQTKGDIKVIYQNNTQEKISSVMNGTPIKSSGPSDNFSIDVFRPNFQDDKTKPGYGILVTSVDVDVSGSTIMDGISKKISVSARVALAPPIPYDTKLKYRLKGSSDPFLDLTDGADLSGGQYEFAVFASGIAYDAAIFVNGKEEARVGGLNEKREITHEAVNYNATGKQLGPPAPIILKAEVATKPATPAPSAPSGNGNYSFNDSTCIFTGAEAGGGAGGGGGAAAIPPPPPPSTGTKKLKAIAYGPDGTASEPSQEVEVTVEAPPPPPAAGGSGTDAKGDGTSTLTQGDYASMCASSCEWIPTDTGDGKELGRIGKFFKPESDLSSYWVFKQAQDPGKWKIYTRKLCVNFKGSSNPTFNLDFADYIIYNPKDCSREFVFQRGACGCVTGDTTIVMEDGKSTKRIDELTQDDKVWNPIMGRAYPLRKVTRGPETVPMIQIVVSGREIKATGKHPFHTRQGIVPAYKLALGDEILIDGKSFAPISALQSLPVKAGDEAPLVWNLEIEAPNDDHDAHHVIANGITTGDLMIQRKLEAGLIK